MRTASAINSTVFSKQLIVKLWLGRSLFTEYERVGLNQLIITTAHSHIEHTFKQLIAARINSIHSAVNVLKDTFTPFSETNINQTTLHNLSNNVLLKSINQVLGVYSENIENFSLEKLQASYETLFSKKLKNVLDSTVTNIDDLSLLSSIRNFISHGSNFQLTYNNSELDITSSKLLRKSVSRLIELNLIDKSILLSSNYHGADFFSESLAMYFWHLAQNITESLIDNIDFKSEESSCFVIELPNLLTKP